jgi:hypothetical protein
LRLTAARVMRGAARDAPEILQEGDDRSYEFREIVSKVILLDNELGYFSCAKGKLISSTYRRTSRSTLEWWEK